MRTFCQRSRWLAIAVGLGLSWSSGCQTYFPETGQTLPSGWYLRHPPQFFPPTPAFPLPREQAGLEQAASQPTAVPPALQPRGGAAVPP
jgi:hypothetical protein